MRVLIAGGPLCTRVCQLLAKDQHEILLLTGDSPAEVPPNVQLAYWDGHSVDVWHDHLSPDCAIINLVGAGQPMCDSHLEAADAINQAVMDTGIVPDTLLQTSSVAYYGEAGDDMLIEASPPGSDPLAALVQQWETITATLDSRQCWLRFGHILWHDTDLRALSDSQAAWLPWLHVDDMARALRFLLNDGVISGPVNMVAPNPITYARFGHVVHALRGHGANGKTTLTYPSQRVLPQTLLSLGFNFVYADAEDALRMLVL